MGHSVMDALLIEIRKEVLRAAKATPPITSPHEGYALILSELDALWEAIKKGGRDQESYTRIEDASLCVAVTDARFILDVVWQRRPHEPLDVEGSASAPDRISEIRARYHRYMALRTERSPIPLMSPLSEFEELAHTLACDVAVLLAEIPDARLDFPGGTSSRVLK